jgi:hypothetical protein
MRRIPYTSELAAGQIRQGQFRLEVSNMTNLIKVAPEGPKLGNCLVTVLNKKQSAQLHLLIGFWLIATMAFAIWWIQPAHFTGPIRFGFNSFILAWSLIIPGYYFYFICRMKKPNLELEIPFSWRIVWLPLELRQNHLLK